MKTASLKTLSLLFLAALGFCASERVHAQTIYFQDFASANPGATSFGDSSQLFSTQTGTNVGIVDTFKELQLTEASMGMTSAFILPVLDTNVAITAFSAKWNAIIAGNFPNAADGYSFNFGPFTADAGLVSTSYQQESGYTNGISLAVQTYPGNSPGFYLRSHGATLASAPYDSGNQWGTNNFRRHYFEVDWNSLSGMTVHVDHQVIFSNVAMTGFTPQVGDCFVWAARSGGSSETVRLDNFMIVTRGNFRKLSVGTPYIQDDGALSSGGAAFAGLGSFYVSQAIPALMGGTLSSAKPVRAYAITTDSLAANAPNRPSQWVLQGFDGVGGSSSNPTVSGDLGNPSETSIWKTTDTNAYSTWLLKVLANHGGAKVFVDEVELYEVASAPPGVAVPADQGNFGFFTTNYHTAPMSFAFTVDSEGAATSAVFDWGTNTSSYSHTFTTNVAAGASPVAVFAPLGSLTPAGDLQGNTDYHYRITVQNANGTVQTADQTFHVPSYIPLNLTNVDGIRAIDSGIVAADFDRDGKMDLLLNGEEEGTTGHNNDVIAALNNFTGEPTRPGLRRSLLAMNPSQLFGNSWGCLAVDDFNNDRRLDFYESGMDGASALNFEAGADISDFLFMGYDPVPARNAFADPVDPKTNGFMIMISSLPFYGGAGTFSAVADFNGDGRKDVLVANGGGNDFPGTAPENENGKLPPFVPNLPFGSPRLFFQSQCANQGLVQLVNFDRTRELPGPAFLFQAIPGPSRSSLDQRAVEGDYDNDGNADIILCPGGLYHNDGFGNFTHVTNAFSGVSASWGPADESTIRTAAWGDFNNDGLLDVIINYAWDKSYLYLNLGNGTFTNTGVILDSEDLSSGIAGYDYAPVIAVADMDHDGQLDVYDRYVSYSDFIQPLQMADVIFYNHNGIFTPESLPTGATAEEGVGSVDLINFAENAVAIADFNNDGRLDLAECGGWYIWSTSHPQTWMIFNLKGTSNQPPTAPAGLSTTTAPGTVTLNWGYGTDDVTPSNSLTYNIRIGTTPGNDNIMGSLALTNGIRLVPRPGNKWLAHTASMHLPPGTYYWSVQAIDGGFAGSPFAPDQTFTVTGDTPPHFCDTLQVDEHPHLVGGPLTYVTLSSTLWTGYENASFTFEYGLTTNYDHVITQPFVTNEIFHGYNGFNGYDTNIDVPLNIVSVHTFQQDLPITNWGDYHWRLTVGNSMAIISMSDTAPQTIVPNLGTDTGSGNQLKLIWPEAPGFQLEYKARLTDAVWLTNASAAVLASGYSTVTVAKDAPMRFFRLHKP